MAAAGDEARGEFHRLALDKMTAVLGPERAAQLLTEIQEELGLELGSAQDLYRFSQRLARKGGFEGAVGAMLSVTAVIRGAARTD